MNLRVAAPSTAQAPLLEMLSLVGSLHYRMLEVVSADLDRAKRYDITPVQALMIYNIGDKSVAAGEVVRDRHYLGSNPSYNLKKLIGNGLLSHARNKSDGRRVCIALTSKGHIIRDIVVASLDRYVDIVRSAAGVSTHEIEQTIRLLRRLDGLIIENFIY